MTGYRLTPAAQRDLASIWDYTTKRWDLHQAESYIGEIRAAVERVSEDPRRGRVRDEIHEGYSSYSVVGHVRFYRVNDDVGVVDLMRILHQRMDAARHL